MEEPIIGTEEQPDSLLAQLAAKRQVIAETKDVFLPVPGYDREPPKLMIKYRLLTGAELTRLGEKVRREVKGRWDRQLFAAIDTFIAACEGLYVDLDDGNGPQPLTIRGNPVVGFTPDLAEALGFADKIDDPNRARNVVFGLFANNENAIARHNFQLNRWMSDTSTDVSQELFETGNL